MRRDQLIQYIAESPSPVPTQAAALATGLTASAETLAAADLLLTFSPEVTALPNGWVGSADTQDRRILRTLRAYAEVNSELRIFRAAAALGNLPAEDQLTEPRLRELLTRTGEFQLIANGMIKRGS